MGKLSSILTVFMFINIIGYLLMAAAIEEGFRSEEALGDFSGSQSFLGSLYTPVSYTDETGQHTIFVPRGTPGVTDNSTIVGSIPQQTPSSLIQAGISFVDRIFVVFGFIRVVLGVLLFPVALATYIGLPYQIAMLFIVPLLILYLIGFMDLISGGNN